MKVSPCFDQSLEIISLQEDKTRDNKLFLRLTVKVWNYARTENGRIPLGMAHLKTVLVWQELDTNFPKIKVGDIIEGERIVLTSKNVDRYFKFI